MSNIWRRRLIAGGASFLLLAACAGTAPAPPPGVASAAPLVSASPRRPSPAATGLAALLPDTVGDVDLAKFSMTGQQFLASSVTPEFREALERLDAGPEDVSFAAATAAGVGRPLSITVVRIAGADPGRLAREFRESQERTPGSTVTGARIGGRDVLQVTMQGQSASQFVYPSEDRLFFVQSPDQSLAAEAIAALP